MQSRQKAPSTPSSPDAAPTPEAAPAGPQGQVGNAAVQAGLPPGGGDCEVRVQRGDTLWGLAQQHLGSGRDWRQIYAWNRSTVGDDPDLIHPDQVLNVCTPAEDANSSTDTSSTTTGPLMSGGEEEVLQTPALPLEDPDVSPEERVQLAEAARDTLSDRLSGMQRLAPEHRDRILARVQGLSGDALAEEMRVIEHALHGPNGDRAMTTLSELHGMREGDEDAAARLTPEVMEMLVNGVADRRTDSDRGQEGNMGVRTARNAAQALIDMNGSNYAETIGLLRHAGQDADGNAVAGSDAGAEQALILESLGARRDRVDTNIFQDIWSRLGGETEGDRAMAEVRGFAEDIRGEQRDDLIRTTTLLDIDDVNTSTIDPDNIAANNDTRANNDGLYQRFQNSCAPTTAQIVRGEADPIFARAVHDDGLNNADPHSVTGEQQRSTLQETGGDSSSRLGRQALASTTAMATTLEGEGGISATQRTAMDRLLAGQDLSDADQADADAAIAAIRTRNNNHPTDAELAAMRENNGRREQGAWQHDALNSIASEGTGLTYAQQAPTGGNLANDLPDIDRRLLEGDDVPFDFGWSGGNAHAMSIVDVRYNADGTRQYLISDPWEGDTNWVSQADFLAGNVAGDTGGRVRFIATTTE